MAVLNRPKVKKAAKTPAIAATQPALTKKSPNSRRATAQSAVRQQHNPFGPCVNQEFTADLDEPLTIAKMARLQRQFIASLEPTTEALNADIPQDDSWTA